MPDCIRKIVLLTTILSTTQRQPFIYSFCTRWLKRSTNILSCRTVWHTCVKLHAERNCCFLGNTADSSIRNEIILPDNTMTTDNPRAERRAETPEDKTVWDDTRKGNETRRGNTRPDETRRDGTKTRLDEKQLERLQETDTRRDWNEKERTREKRWLEELRETSWDKTRWNQTREMRVEMTRRETRKIKRCSYMKGDEKRQMETTEVKNTWSRRCKDTRASVWAPAHHTSHTSCSTCS